ncbi:MAG: OsmC family protein [Solirubrobacteraceae bacterium]|nr:OsmC family protein [Solirubrobacteraceae bacterium]
MASTTNPVRNGVDTATMFGTLDLLGEQPELGRFVFRAANEWVDGAHNRSEIRGFYAAGGEDATRDHGWTLDAGEPAILLGSDTGPNPAEHLLHALAACLTTTLVFVAAARKVELTRVCSHLEGEMDVRGCLGVDEGPRNGFERIRARFEIEGDAPAEKLDEILERAQARSAVFDMVTNGVTVEVTRA